MLPIRLISFIADDSSTQKLTMDKNNSGASNIIDSMEKK